jgi:hypothetical protein
VYGRANVLAITDDDSPHNTRYGVFECQDCHKRFVAKKTKYVDDGWIPVYPISHKSASKEVLDPIKGEYEEAWLCFAVQAYRASVSMCEIALEALWRDNKASNLSELFERGIISKRLLEHANEVRRWGNVAKHEPIPDVVSQEDCKQLLEYLEAILDHVYVQPVRLDALKQKRSQVEGKAT